MSFLFRISLPVMVLAIITIATVTFTSNGFAFAPRQQNIISAEHFQSAIDPVIKVQARKRRPSKRRRGNRRTKRPPAVHLPQKRRNFRRNMRRRHWGRRIGGVILGTAIGVAIAGTIPRRPHADLCWNWSDNSRRRGYWYYCVEPPY